MQARRLARAEQLWRTDGARVKVRRNTVIAVPSQTIPHRRYNVQMQQRGDYRSVVAGECPDYKMRRPMLGCKHMLVARKYLTRHPEERKWKL
jgi:hypothetical protein